MKSILLVLLLGAVTQPNFNAIAKALNSGNATELSRHFDESLEVAVLENEDFYDRSEAQEVVAGFFSSNKPKSFKLMHQGTAKNNGSKYGIGNLQTSSGTFRVYFYLKGDKIQELRIEKE